MHRSQRPKPLVFELAVVGLALILAACSSSELSGPRSRTVTPPVKTRIALDCTASVAEHAVSCQAKSTAPRSTSSHADVIGGQGMYVQLTSTNVAYEPISETFSFDATVQNLLNEAIGSPDGQVVDSAGIKVFFSQQPVATAGTGAISVVNADGTGNFTSTNQPFYKYDVALQHDEVSPSKVWQFHVPSTVSTFHFTVYVATMIQPLLVINEVFVNPGGTITDANGEWFEVYNAGTMPVEMQGLAIADSAASGRRPYHIIASSLVVNPGGYVVLGENPDTTVNGGVRLDYSYPNGLGGSALTLANSLDAVKISMPGDFGFGPDTVTIDQVHYSSPGTSAQNGISRELINPALDNLNMDGSNWADATVTSVYGPGGRGTPKAQNSTFVP